MKRALVAIVAAAGALAMAVPALPAAAGSTHPALTLTVAVSRVERGGDASAVLCWRHAPLGWVTRVTSANSVSAAPVTVYAATVTSPSGCARVALPTDTQGGHPITGSLVSPTRQIDAVAFAALYVYAPVQAKVFLKNILHPACHGHGTVVIAGRSYAWTCSMAAVTSHQTVTSTSCRRATLKMASTDDPAGSPTAKGRSIFELAQNVNNPSFKRFHDDVAVAISVPLSGSEFWVAFKSTNPTSRLYFLDQGATADCYTANGLA